MRVGVYLGNFEPSIGGGFTFVSAVMNAFFEQAPRTSHEYTLFASPSYLKEIAERVRPDGIELCAVPRGFFARGSMLARHYVPAYAVLAGGGRLQRAALRRRIQFMWFVGGGAYDALDIPYMATVWDVQHRTHPWFPEVANRGTWDYREIALARFLRRASRIITGTRTGVEQLGWYYQIPPDRIEVLPHPTPMVADGDDGTAAPSRPDITRLAGRRFLLYPAQLWPHKNHANLVAAVSLVRQRTDPDIELVLTGADKGNGALVRRLAADLGISSSVHLLGFVSPGELHYLYKHALALTYVSWSGPENLPPLEAFSVGCPVINADFAGAREQLGDAALYVDPGDPASIAAGIEQLLADDAKRSTLVERGRERARSWTAADYVAGVIRILDDFVSIRRCWE